MEAKLPENPNRKGYSQAICWDDCQRDMLQFFIDFLDEHIEFSKEKRLEYGQLVALKINFQGRFMSEKNNGK